MCFDAMAEPPWHKVPELAVPKWQPPKPAKKILSNGINAFLQVDPDELTQHFLVRIAGGSWDDAEKIGRAQLLASTWFRQGSKDPQLKAFDNLLIRFGMKISITISGNSVNLETACLPKICTQVIPKFAALLRLPIFPEEQVNLAKQMLLSQMQLAELEPNNKLDIVVNKLVFGATHTLSQFLSKEKIEQLSSKDLLAYHQNFVHPQNITIGVSGPFVEPDMADKIETWFGKWTKPGMKYKHDLEPLAPFKPGVYFVPQDTSVARVQLVKPAPFLRNDPLAPVFSRLQYLLIRCPGTLFKEIRTNRGLAYVVQFMPGITFKTPDVTSIYLETNPQTVDVAVDVLLFELKRLKLDPPTEQDFIEASESHINALPFTRAQNLTSSLVEYLNLLWWNYPENFYETYEQAVRKVTQPDLEKIIGAQIDLSTFALVVAGPPTAKAQLEAFAKLNKLGPIVELSVPVLYK